MQTIMVFPAKQSAVGMAHPTHGKMRESGSQWPRDSFTCRRLVDGSITETAPRAATKPVENRVVLGKI